MGWYAIKQKTNQPIKFLELDYVAHSSVWLSNDTQSRAMHKMSVHQLLQYY